MDKYLLFEIISELYKVKPPGKKALQKIVYLIQRKDIDLKCPFSIHYYGPYSSTLDYSLQSMEREGLIEMQRKGFSWLIMPNSGEKDLFFEDEIGGSINDHPAILEVLDLFGARSPRDLEVITTTDFVAEELKIKGLNSSKEIIIEGVKKIKGDKFTFEQIEKAYRELQVLGFQ